PFSITSGIRFFEQAHVKDVIAYVKLAGNPRDELSFKRVVQLLPGIGGKGADRLWRGFSSEETGAHGGDARSKSDDRSPAALSNTSNSGPPADRSPGQAKGHQHHGGSEALDKPTETRRSAMRLQGCAGHVPKKAAVAWAQLVATVAQ